MKKIYRAADTSKLGQGACFTEAVSDAKKYQDNPGFGGRNLFETTLDGEVLDLESGGDGWRHQGPREVLFAAVGLDLNEVDEEGNPLHEDAQLCDQAYHVWENGCGVSLDDLADAGYRWVRYEDDYPVGCITYVWTGLGETPILEGLSIV